MTCAPCTYSPAPGGGCSQTSFLAMSPSVPSNGTPTPAPSSESDPLTDGSPGCTCTKETCGCSIHPPTRAEWIASMQGSLARILASPEMARVSMASEAASIVKSCASLTWFDRDSSSWKTRQQSLATDWEPYLETWPRAGTMVGGQSWPLLTWVRPISANDGGACSGAPTPTVCGNYNRKGASATSGDGLATWVGKMLPTPRASDGAKGGPNQLQGGKPALANIAAKWPTPKASTNRVSKDSLTKNGHWSAPGLEQMAELSVGILPREVVTLDEISSPAARRTWATPLASDWKSHSPAKQATNSRPLREQIGASDGGALNPPWVAWLMGWPLGHTKLPPLAMDKFLYARRRRGKYLEGSK